jgi:hypothetical protein
MICGKHSTFSKHFSQYSESYPPNPLYPLGLCETGTTTYCISRYLAEISGLFENSAAESADWLSRQTYTSPADP